MMELIPSQVLADIKSDFAKVISYDTSSIQNPQIDEIFEQWQAAKSIFIVTFGGLIWESPEELCLKLSKEEKNEYWNAVIKQIEEYYDPIELESSNSNLILNWLQNFVGVEGFFNNRTIKEFVFYDSFQDKEITIPKDSKVLKSFKFFIHDDKELRNLQDIYSHYQQLDNFKGRLCLSVHPLDFLSISNNASNWTTCHSMGGKFGGEYRSGNICYMIDNTTFICYLKKNDQLVPIKGFPKDVPWNDKKWRMLCYLSQDYNMIMTGRQYPMQLGYSILEELKNAFKSCLLIDNNKYAHWTDWTQEYFKMDTKNFITSRLYPKGEHKALALNDFVKRNTYLCFIDMLDSYSFNPWWIARIETSGGLDNENSKFIIGDRFKCLRCGKNLVSYSDSLLCKECIEEVL